jgi:tRNA G10  N-methylase Trm11
VSVGRLPKQLSNLPQITFFGHAKQKIVEGLKANFEAYEMLYLPTLKNDSMNLRLDARYLVTVAAIIV